MKWSALPMILVVTAACAAPVQQVPVVPPPTPTPVPAAAAAADFDPVGVYDFTTEVQGTTVPGVLTIRRGDQGLAGTLATDVTGELPLQQITIEGRRGEMRASTQEGGMIMRIEFVEDRIRGGWELPSGMSGSVTGQRRPPRQ
jgi:hypothetical protein